MRPILGCQLRGSYLWQQTTLSTDTIDIRDQEELFAKLPIGALALQGELARSGQLRVQTTVSGQYRLAGSGVADVPDYGDCAQATHLLTGVSIGSFKLQSGDQITSAASLGTDNAGAGANTHSSEAVLREAGDFESCQQATAEEPHLGCTAGAGVGLIGTGVYLMTTSGPHTEVYSDRGRLARHDIGSPARPVARQVGARIEF